MKKFYFLENSVLICLIISVMIGNTSYNGASLATLKEQERIKLDKEFNEQMTEKLENKNRDYLSSFIQTLNNTTIANEEASMQSFSSEQSEVVSVNTKNTYSSNPIISSYNTYKQKNNDTVGWIRIADTQVDYPIMYSNDNNYYLNRSPNKISSQYGSIFLDQQSNGQWGVLNLIHGHNMNNGSMFGDVAKMMNEPYFSEHNKIQIYDGKTLKEYTAFCAFSLDDTKEGIPVQYSSLDEYYAVIDDYVSRSRVEGEYPDGCTDFIILNTCWYGDSGGEKNLHAIIVAYRSN